MIPRSLAEAAGIRESLVSEGRAELLTFVSFHRHLCDGYGGNSDFKSPLHLAVGNCRVILLFGALGRDLILIHAYGHTPNPWGHQNMGLHVVT